MEKALSSAMAQSTVKKQFVVNLCVQISSQEAAPPPLTFPSPIPRARRRLHEVYFFTFTWNDFIQKHERFNSMTWL